MKNIEAIKVNISKEINFAKLNYYNIDNFISDSKEYISAIREGRMINSIGSVSGSGMSRTIKFLACYKNRERKQYYYRNFFAFFKSLDFSPVKDSDYFRINGCGMDMIFHTNYTIIHRLKRIGFITKKQCERLSQMTPNTI
jgi:hypothetical protein